jgi:hypothetical protein
VGTEAYRVRLDGKRRPTLPARLLAEAEIEAGEELMARAEGKGRIVLEEPAVALSALQAAVAEGKQSRGITQGLAERLADERSSDTSLA